MKIAIVEDHPEEQRHLHAMLEQYCATRNVQAEIQCFASGDALLEIFTPGSFQCVFLDIYMDGTDGMETARQIYRQDSACRLIFATVSIEHAVTSYEVRAAWYLTKPFSAARLAEAMDAACLHLMHSSRVVTLHMRGTEFHIRFGDIYFIDCHNRQARVHLRERTLEVSETINELLARIASDERFLVCNRNTAVNMEHIELVTESDFQMQNGIHVPIRQRGSSAIKKHYLAWSLRDLRQGAHV